MGMTFLDSSESLSYSSGVQLMIRVRGPGWPALRWLYTNPVFGKKIDDGR